MININIKNEKLKAELKDIIRMYVPFFEGDLNISLNLSKDKYSFTINSKTYTYSCSKKVKYNYIKSSPTKIKMKTNSFATSCSQQNLCKFNKKIYYRNINKRFKKSFYLSLSKYFNKKLPWGSLTGIRPTKIAYSYLNSGGKINNISALMQARYFVSSKKARITSEIIVNQQNYLTKGDNYVNLYIHIPFCPTKCEYCSFLSLPTYKNEQLIEDYLALLCVEIKATLNLLVSKQKQVLSIYIGGGTPSILSCVQLKQLLSSIDVKNILHHNATVKSNFKSDLLKSKNEFEFTLEAGRPDTISKEKLLVMKEYGVNRLSINPQTFLQKTLQKIGRNHSVSSIYSSFFQAKELGFIINMDLIAGLHDEKLKDFKYSLQKTKALKPHNITIHTLSIKNGSKSFDKGVRHFKGLADKMLNYAYKALKSKGYSPYYLYRQKNMADNLENIGYCLKGCQSVNNITVMEESVSVWGCGAGAISKVVNGRLINRLASLRDVNLYIKNFEQRLNEKLKFLSK